MSCNDGEEQRLGELLSYVETHVSLLTEQFGQVGEDRLMLMASLMIADELWDLRDDLEENARRAQEELRALAGIDRKPDADKSNGLHTTSADYDDKRDKKLDSSVETQGSPPSADMDIGIDHRAPDTRTRAYR